MLLQTVANFILPDSYLLSKSFTNFTDLKIFYTSWNSNSFCRKIAVFNFMAWFVYGLYLLICKLRPLLLLVLSLHSQLKRTFFRKVLDLQLVKISFGKQRAIYSLRRHDSSVWSHLFRCSEKLNLSTKYLFQVLIFSSSRNFNFLSSKIFYAAWHLTPYWEIKIVGQRLCFFCESFLNLRVRII